MIGVVCPCGGVRTNGRCDRCHAGKGRHELSRHKRGYDSRWMRLSERYRQENPLCVVCETEGRVRAATEVHHVIPIHSDPTRRLDVDNLMAVCRECHEKIEGSPGG